MDLLQILLVIVGAVCAGYLIWCLIRATRYMRNHPDEFGCSIIAILLLFSVQPLAADNNQPRFMIPTVDITDAGISGFSAITEGNPYFTVYLWYRNTNGDNTYWKNAPFISVDGHEIQLSGLVGSHEFDEQPLPGDWSCIANDKLYYTIHARPGFKVKDKDTFAEFFPDLKTKDNYKDDYYIPLDIYIHENRKGETHTVTAHGYVHTDKGASGKDEEHDVLGLNGEKELQNSVTVCPFTYSDYTTSLEWTSPGHLTYTSAEFEEKKWGRFRVIYDGKQSPLATDGVIAITKDYGENADYKSNEAKKVEYRYEGVYYVDKPTVRDTTRGVCHIMASDFYYGMSMAYTYETNRTLLDFSQGKGFLKFEKHRFTFGEDCDITVSCSDRRICKVTLEPIENGAEAIVFDHYDDPQYELTLPVPQGSYSEFQIEYELPLTGYSIVFTNTFEKAPKSLPYPTGLTIGYDSWNKTNTLKWQSANVTANNRAGSYKVYRNGDMIKSIDSNYNSSDYEFADEKVEYDTLYQYKIGFMPSSWNIDYILDSLSVSATAKLERSVAINDLKVETQSDGYKLSWSISPKLDKSGYEFKIYRRTVTADHANLTADDFKDLNPIGTVTVNNINETKFTYMDNGVTSTATYSYLVRIDNVQEATLTAGPVVPEGHPDASQIKSLSASRGTYTDHVHLAWDEAILGDDNITYDIYRHRIEEGENEISSATAQQLDWVKLATLVSSTAKPVNSYDDYAAIGGYYYFYSVVARPNGSNEVFTMKTSDGFVRSTGTVYGSVTYADGKYAVQGVKVQMSTSATNTQSLFNALGFEGGSGGIHWNITPERYSYYFSGPFSTQMYVRPSGNAADSYLLDMGEQLKLQLTDYDAAEGYLIAATAGGDTQKTTHRIKANHFTHVTFAYDGNGRAKVYLMAPDSLGSIATDELTLNCQLSAANSSVSIAVASATDSTQAINGYIDEVRFFKRCLTEADVLQNYSHFMGGTESGLVAYWPFDENITTLRWAYDYSKTSNIANENHANIVGGRRTNIETPTADQLSLYAVTDTVGTYTLRGIPFAGEGTTYSLIPTKGAHRFTPTTRTLYVSPETLSFDPQNFADNSSFNVKGVVYYENTTYPVKGCRFRVDDVVVKDEWGKEITSDENGEFTIPVSIGEHAIYIEKDGHTFLHNGRYPAEGVHNFNDSISGLTFTDQTKAVVVGRVVGGATEKEKPVGIGRSSANIGKATLTLLTSNSIEDSRRMNVTLDSNEGTYESNADTLYYEQANPEYVKSKAWVGGTKDGSDAVKTITIQTDPNTGEFAVLLPPVPYYVRTKVDNNAEATGYLSGQTILDCSNVLNPQTAEDEERSLTYHTAFVQAYFAAPNISVWQSDNSVGAFGDAKVPAGELNDTVDTYRLDENQQLVYNYGYPIFTSCKTYEFDIQASEKYYNYDIDPEHPTEYNQPSTEGYLTIKNPMLLTADTVGMAPLDSEGKYTYRFQAIEPNEVDPYTQPIDIMLKIGDNEYQWDWQNGQGMQCVVLGAKCTGQTSITAAPDQLIHVLRDPFGSNSYQKWHSGSTKHPAFDIGVGASISVGGDFTGAAGATIKEAVGAPGLYFYVGSKMFLGNSTGLSWKGSLDVNGGANWTITSTEDFQTSADPRYDGPEGDVYIGTSTSLVYGDGQKVMLVDDQAGGFKVGTKEVIATAQTLGTTFAYSQYYILNDLIPNYKRLREAKLIQVSEAELAEKRASFTNYTDSVIYMTSLTPDDPRFGTNNDDESVWGEEAVKKGEVKWRDDHLCYYGPSYTAFPPANGNYRDEEEPWDAIVTLNSNISLWEFYISYNEEGKVKAFRHKAWGNSPYSFDSGTTIEFGHEDKLDESETIAASGTLAYYYKWFMHTATSATATTHTEGTVNFNIDGSGSVKLTGEREWTDSYSVSLSDQTYDNSHQVEVFRVTDGYDFGGFENDGQNGYGGFIFRQISGQTSCHYEGEERTKYYEPGSHILSYATVQAQVPHIDCAHPDVTGVPAGEPAVFDLKLSNASLANLTESQTYWLFVVKDKWGQMAEVSINGLPGVNKYNVELGPGDTYNVKVKVTPASSDIIHIDSLCLSLYSDCEWQISDEIYLSAHFQPKAEPVTLKASRTLVNTSTDSTLVLTASGYNANSTILNGVRLQQRKAGAPEWTTIHSWVKGTPAGDTESALPAERIDTLIDMHSSIFYPDATYEFRAVTDCTVSGEVVLGESDVITVIKDVTLPKPIQLPEPADGVLNEGDNISVTFNEDIYSQSLNKPDNFIIQSVLNTDSVAHEVALKLDGAASPAATSQSGLTLSGTSFTLCSWVKNSGKTGTLFRHGEGQNAFRVGINGDGYLTANIRDENGVAQTYTSMQPVPKDSWSYVAVVYDYNMASLSAYYASGDNEATLMADVPVGKHAKSEGYIYLGEGLTGAMHELSLYSAALTWTTIKAQMYLGKSNTTPALIGYWRLDEGHDTESEDRARSRHMILASKNNWYLENANISMNLDGTNYAAIPMGQLSSMEGASYLVEMWVLANLQNPDAQLLSLDNGKKLDLNLNKGRLQLVADSVVYATSSSINDHQWHHVALNVLKNGNGQASLLVDGVSVLTVAANKIPALAGAKLWLGKNMKGAMDEVRLWHGTNTQQTINDRMYYRMDGSKESSLVGYWPMEKTYYDEYNQCVFEFSMENKGYQATEATTLIPNTEGAVITEGSDAPGLKEAPHKSNLDFDFVADERTVAVTLEHSAESLEGCTVSTTLRDYYDLHTNVGTPITWSFVVKQNTLSWNTAEVSPKVMAGYSGTFTATLTNNGEADQTWSFTELPSWLEASPSSGIIFAHGSEEITFTVKPGNTIGKYFTTVSARGNKGLDTPLDICLTVEGQLPDWTAAYSGDYMALIGQIKIDGIVSTDPDDMVGAFTGSNGTSLGECLGVAKPVYNAQKDAYYVSMKVYGTTAMEGNQVYFRLYDASTGKTYPLTNASKDIKFAADDVIGSTADPVIWENSDKLLQVIDMKMIQEADSVTHWISLYLEPDNSNIENLFRPVSNSIVKVETADNTYRYNGQGWSPSYDGIKAGEMMKVTMTADGTLPVIGSAVDPNNFTYTVNPGNNWLGVPCDSYMTLEEAFAKLEPVDGDVVKGQTAFAYYEGGQWEGDLEAIEPGKGYIYNSKATGPKQFKFPSYPSTKGIGQWEGKVGIAANFKYGHNMILICTLHDGFDLPVLVDGIEVYDSNGELRGITTRCFRDSIYVIIISGDTEDETIQVRPVQDNGTASVSRRSMGEGFMMQFNRDKILGRPRNPIVLQLGGGANGISEFYHHADSRLTVYNTLGNRLYHGRAADFDRNRLPANAVYIITEETCDGRIISYKRLNK